MTPSALDNLISANSVADDAAILAMCAADPRTVGPISLSALTPWLNSGGRKSRLTRTAGSDVFGAVVTSVLGAGAVQAARDELNDAIDYLYSPHNDQLDSDTNDPATANIASSTDQMFALMVACNAQDATLGLTSTEVTAFRAFGGGYLLKDATQDDVTASRARLAATARAASFDAYRSDLFAKLAAFFNETVNPAQVNGGAVPTLADAKAYWAGLS